LKKKVEKPLEWVRRDVLRCIMIIKFKYSKQKYSIVVVWLLESNVVRGVDFKVASVDIVTLHYHLEHFRLVHGTFFHKVDYLVLNGDGVVDVVVKLHLKLVLQLSVLLQKLLVVYGVGKVFVIFGEETGFADVGPVVKLVSHGVLGPDAQVLATPEEEELVDLLIKVFPVEHVGNPSKTVS
jgi:hypothetical protein